ncbi:nondiscriminating glutamyl-tRNA synthetase [Desulfitispora alkaliphila]|uniref:glutamate--tRNA ligase n=1 Tax=Desulfitispora alkaliphila TaxID=622674 RepID=UPI003D2409E8
MEKMRVRFAPSPTGPLHIGGARSALFNYLLAKQSGGEFIVRIEDTDLERSNRESEENILSSLQWLGIEWDEGVDKGGDKGPYRQTERMELYRTYLDQLLQNGDAYYCYCSEEELEAERKELMDKGELPRYLGKCRNLGDAERECREKEGRKPVIRFKVTPGMVVTINDMVRNHVSFESDGIGDYIIAKSDGIPTYNFAVVIDDALMEITHVVRAEEHLSNTPRQIMLYKALGLQAPKFAHISLILGKDRTKMSKRHGSTSVVQYREQGYLPEAIVNFLALLGWSPEEEEEIFTMEQLIEKFSMNRVAKNPAIFDLDKLNWINGYYIRQTPVEKITKQAIPHFQKAGLVGDNLSEAELKRLEAVVGAVQTKISHLSEIVEKADVFFNDKLELAGDKELEVLKGEQVPSVLDLLTKKLEPEEELTVETVKPILKSLTKELELGGKKVYMPLRIALTGKTQGPELFDLIPILGLDGVKNRIAQAKELAGM